MFRRKEQPKSEKEPLQIKNMTDTMDSSWANGQKEEQNTPV